MSWELLPPLECRLARSKIAPAQAQKILMAYIHGSTKSEIARIFGERLAVVQAVIKIAREAAMNENASLQNSND